MPSKSTQFKPGQSGNSKGRPKGARNKITQQAEAALAELTCGKAAKASLEKLRDEQPAAFWRLAISLLPKQARTEADGAEGRPVILWGGKSG